MAVKKSKGPLVKLPARPRNFVIVVGALDSGVDLIGRRFQASGGRIVGSGASARLDTIAARQHADVGREIDRAGALIGDTHIPDDDLLAIAALRPAKAAIKSVVSELLRSRFQPVGVLLEGISRLAPLWLSACEALGATPRIVVAVRDPADISSSAGADDQLLDQWLSETKAAVSIAERHSAAVVTYADLRQYPDIALSAATTRLGLAPLRNMPAVQSVPGAMEGRARAATGNAPKIDPLHRRLYESALRVGEPRQPNGDLPIELGHDMSWGSEPISNAAPSQPETQEASRMTAHNGDRSGRQHDVHQRRIAELEAQLEQAQARDRQIDEGMAARDAAMAHLISEFEEVKRAAKSASDASGVRDIATPAIADSRKSSRKPGKAEADASTGITGEAEMSRLRDEAAEMAAENRQLRLEAEALKVSLAAAANEAGTRAGDAETRLAEAEKAVADASDEIGRLRAHLGEMSRQMEYLRADADLAAQDFVDGQRRSADANAAQAKALEDVYRKVVSLQRTEMAGRSEAGPIERLGADLVAHLADVLREVDTDFYTWRYADVAEAGVPAWTHYHEFGQYEGRSPNAVHKWCVTALPDLTNAVAAAHRLFDRTFYCLSNPDVIESGLDPEQHYRTYGAAEGRAPNAFFYPTRYREIWPSAAPFADPLVHYALVSLAGTCDVGGFYDDAYYRQARPDLDPRVMRPLEHFVRHGVAEGMRPSSEIDVGSFLSDEERHALSPSEQGYHVTTRAAQAASGVERILLPVSAAPAISIIVYARDNATAVACCLSSIRSSLPSVAVEVLLVDDQSHDLLPLMIDNWSGVRYIRTSGVRDWRRAYNLAAAAARGGVLVFVDGNVDPAVGSIQRLVTNMADPNVAVAGARLTDLGQGIASDEPVSIRPEFFAVRANIFFLVGGFPKTASTPKDSSIEFERAVEKQGMVAIMNHEATGIRFKSGPWMTPVTRRTGLPRSGVGQMAVPAVTDGIATSVVDDAVLDASVAPDQTDVIEIRGFSRITIVTDETVAANELLASTRVPPHIDVRHVLIERGQARWAEWANAGVSQAVGDAVLLVGEDARPRPNWLIETLATFERDDAIAIVGGMVLDAEGRIASAGGLLWSDGSHQIVGTGDVSDNPYFCYQRDVDFVAPTVVGMRSEHVGLDAFDTGYEGANYAIADLALALRSMGKRTVYQPFCVCTSNTPGAVQPEPARLLERRGAMVKMLPAGPHVRSAGLRHLIGEALLLEQHTPTPDQDAGSVIFLELTKQLIELGYAPSFVPEHSLVHAGAYTRALQRIGVCCIYKPFYQNLWEFARDRMANFTLLVPFRAPTVEHYLRIIQPFRPSDLKIILHTQDIHHLREKREAELRGRDDMHAMVEETKARELAGISASSASIVVSEFEAEYLKDEVPDAEIAVLPLIMDVHGRQAEFDGLRDFCFIGGYTHAPNVDAVHYFLSEIWPIVRRALPDARFRIMGSNPPPEFAALDDDRVVVDGFVESLADSLGRCRVSVAPLRFGAGIKGKVGSSLSLGVPCVVSPIAAEGAGFGSHDGVMIGATAQAFADALVNLYSDRELWYRMSDGGMAFVQRRYSTSAACRKLIEICDAIELPVLETARSAVLQRSEEPIVESVVSPEVETVSASSFFGRGLRGKGRRRG